MNETFDGYPNPTELDGNLEYIVNEPRLPDLAFNSDFPASTQYLFVDGPEGESGFTGNPFEQQYDSTIRLGVHPPPLSPPELTTTDTCWMCLLPDCPTPSHQFGRRADLKRHMETCHKGSEMPPYPCTHPNCHRVQELGFYREDKLMEHLRTVHSEPIPKRVGNSSKRPAPRIGGFPCIYEGCGKTFNRACDLKRHAKTHLVHSERPYKCAYCDVSFLYPKDAARHERTHVQAQTSPLQHCTVPGCVSSTGFSRRDNLLRHMRKQHGSSTA